jgi:hypothetical protein
LDAAVTGSRQIVFSSARRAPRRRWTRVVGVLAVVALLAGAGLATVAGGLWLYASARLGGERVPGLAEPAAALGAVSEGTDARGATTVLVALTAPHDPTDPRAPELRGPVALLQLGGPREVPAVLVLPADLPLSIDGLGTATVAEVQEEGDVGLLAGAVADYTGVAVDHVVRASEDALPRLVDLHRPQRCDEGRCTTLTSQDVRRELGEGGARERVQAVVDTLRALAPQLDRTSVLASPLTSKRTVDVVADEVHTDVALRGTGLLELAAALEGAPAPEVALVPMLRNPATGRSVLLEDAEALFQRFREGAPLRAGGPAIPGEDDVASLVGAVPVAVLNGAGVDGLAGRVEAMLAADGYLVVGTGNAPSFGGGGTIVTYDPDDPSAEVAAILLAERLGDVTLQPAERTPMFEGDPVAVVVTAGTDLADG